MKKIYSLVAFMLLFAANVMAQYTTDWIRPADNIAKTGSMITRDSLDNVFVTGFIQSQNIYTRKYNKFGALQWEKTSSSGIASNYEKPVWTSIDKNNNAIVVGYRYVLSSGKDYPNAIVVLKYNPTGFLLWKKVIPVSVVLRRFASGLNLRSEVDNNGNIYVSTVTANISGFALYKLNSSGVLVFTKNSSANAPSGFNSMRLKGSRIAVTGASGTLSKAPVAVWDTAGNLLFTKAVLGQGGSDVEIDDAGNTYLLTSYSNQVAASSGQDISIYKFNSTSVQQWKQSYDFGGSDFSTRFVLAAEKLSVIGYNSTNEGYFDWITFQVNNAGAKLWDARYNATTANDELPAFLAAKDNGEVFVTGKGGPLITQVNGSSYLRMVTLKYSNTGTVKWIDSVNTSGFGISCVLAKDSSLFALSHANMTAYHFIDQTTTGICSIPTGLIVANITATNAGFSWATVTGATLYHLRYKPATATVWTVVSSSLPSISVTTLTAGTTYEYAVEAVCSSGPSGYSATKTFSTTGTGYCTTGGLSQATEYLAFVWIGGIMNSTGSNNGYGDFTHLSTTLTPGQIVNGYMYGLLPYGEFENYAVWIDYNRDNDFNDAGEKVVSLYTNNSGWIAFNFTVPSTGLVGGPTRMRVTMSSGASPTPCGTYARGETEDYTVVMDAPLPATYCATGGLSIANEWISTVYVSVVNPQPGQAFILNNSFSLVSGYTDFTSMSATLNPNDSVRINVGTGTPDLLNIVRHFSIYIDYNQDKDFNDPGEQIINNLITNTLSADIGFRVPATVMAGSTRLRIVMSHDDILSPCGDYPGGETEDYSVLIGSVPAARFAVKQPGNAILPESISISIYPNPASGTLFVKGITAIKEIMLVEVYDITGRKMFANNMTGNSINISALKTGTYTLRVLQNNTTVYTGNFIKN